MPRRLLFLSRSSVWQRPAASLPHEEGDRLEASSVFIEAGDGASWDAAVLDLASWPEGEGLPSAPHGGALRLVILTPPGSRPGVTAAAKHRFPGTPSVELITPLRLSLLLQELSEPARRPEGVTMHERAVLDALREAGEHGLSAQALAVKRKNEEK